MRKRRGDTVRTKKPLARLCACIVGGGCNPGTRFMRCSGNVTRHDERWQAVFLCVHDDHSAR
ncbi:hypothetical protein C9Z41_18230 [Escherichia coli]|nr:hypothetical protein C9Z41_18230 [Escherichia coli]